MARPWPLAKAPLPDELLSSWLVRNAHAHGVRPTILASGMWAAGGPILDRDLDKAAPDFVFDDMARLTGTSRERAVATGLPAYAGTLVAGDVVRGTTQWVLPIGLRNRDRLGFGLQFCPGCLGDDEAPYFRRSWRLAVTAACRRHGLLLLGRCPECKSAVIPHRSSHPASCWRCGLDLRQGEAAVAGEHLLSFQARAEAALAQGWTMLGDTVFGYSHLYFALVRQVAKTLATGPRSARLREVVARTWGGDPHLPQTRSNRRDVELMPVSDRAVLLDLTERVLIGWPARFVGACAEARVWRSWALADAPDPPHAYLHAVEIYLERPSYLPNPEEVAAAVAYLRRTHEKPSREALKRLLGHTTLGAEHLPPLAPEARR